MSVFQLERWGKPRQSINSRDGALWVLGRCGVTVVSIGNDLSGGGRIAEARTEHYPSIGFDEHCVPYADTGRYRLDGRREGDLDEVASIIDALAWLRDNTPSTVELTCRF